MLYAIDDELIVRLKALIASNTLTDQSERTSLIQALTAVEADPIIDSLLWTKSDLVAEYRSLIQGSNPRNPDGTFFQKTSPFVDPLRERLAIDMAGDVQKFYLGIRDDVETDIALAASETLRDMVLTALEEMEIGQVDIESLTSMTVINEHSAHLSPELIAEGLQRCVHYIAEKNMVNRT